MKFVFAFIILLFLFNQSFAQTDSLQKVLSGNSKREWIVKAWKESMGNRAQNACTSGKSYVFSKAGQVNVIECINGQKTTISSQQWIVSDNAQKRIKIGSEEYLVMFTTQSTKPNTVKMRLRELVPDKITPGKIIDFTYEKD